MNYPARPMNVSDNILLYVTRHLDVHTGVNGTDLQTDGTRGSRETSGTFISLLPKHTLLTSGTGLSISSLGKTYSPFVY